MGVRFKMIVASATIGFLESFCTRFKVIVAGATVGFLESFTIWFVPEEPYQSFIVAAGTIKGVLTALLINTLVNRESSLIHALGTGLLFGLLSSAVVFLAKGGWVSWEAPFVVLFGAVGGLILGPTVRKIDRASRRGG